MEAGKMKLKFEVQKASLASSPSGVVSAVWTSLFSLWGMLALPSDRMTVSKDDDMATHVITTRYREDVCSGYRLVLGSRSFLVRGVADKNGERKWIRIFVQEQEFLG